MRVEIPKRWRDEDIPQGTAELGVGNFWFDLIHPTAEEELRLVLPLGIQYVICLGVAQQ